MTLTTEKNPKMDSKNLKNTLEIDSKTEVEENIEKLKKEIEDDRNNNVGEKKISWLDFFNQNKNVPEEDAWAFFFKYMQMENANVATKSIIQPYKYISSKSGKKLRAEIALALAKTFGVEDKFGEKEDKLIEMIQNVTLLFDDMQDGSFLRRGLPCAHLVYGIPQTINSATFFSFFVLKIMVDETPTARTKEVVNFFLDVVFKLHEGQAMEMYWRDNMIVPTEEEYLEMVSLKTSTFFTLILGAFSLITSKAKTHEFIHCFDLLGQYFQIKDDYLNLKSDTYKELKGFAEDISEGKFSFPIIHAIKKFPEDNTILSILKMRTQDPELKKLVINYCEKAGSFEYTEKFLSEIGLKLEKALNKIDEKKELSKLIREKFLLDAHKIVFQI